MSAILRSKPLSPLDRLRFLWTIVFVLILIWWMDDDSRRRGVRMPYDFGAFAFFAWPITIPYYLWRSRGWRGFRLALGLAGLYFVAVSTDRRR